MSKSDIIFDCNMVDKIKRSSIRNYFFGVLAFVLALIGVFVGSAAATNLEVYRKLAEVALGCISICWIFSFIAFLRSGVIGKLLAIVVALLPLQTFLDILRRWNSLFGAG